MYVTHSLCIYLEKNRQAVELVMYCTMTYTKSIKFAKMPLTKTPHQLTDIGLQRPCDCSIHRTVCRNLHIAYFSNFGISKIAYIYISAYVEINEHSYFSAYVSFPYMPYRSLYISRIFVKKYVAYKWHMPA